MELTIRLKVKDVTIELSAQEARDLAEALRLLTGQPVVVQPVPTVVPYVTPWWPDSTGRPWESPWYVSTCGGTTPESMTVQWSDPGGPVCIYNDRVSLSVL